MPSPVLMTFDAVEDSTTETEANPNSSAAHLLKIESLGRRCREGEVAAWSALFPMVWPLLVRFVHRLYHSFDQEDAEDVAQASIEAAIKAIQTFDRRGLFRAWLLGIASQQASNMFRKKSAAKRGLRLVVPLDHSLDYRDDETKSPAELTAESERAALLHRAIEELPEKDRDLVHLHFFGELTFKQIGEVRQMNPKTVCTRLTRCKARLLDLLLRSNLTRADG